MKPALVTTVVLGAVLATASPDGIGAEPALPATLAQVPHVHAPRAGLYTAGQPQPGQWRAIAAAGVGTVVNLRTDAELEGRDERAEVAAAGMRYVHLPVAGEAGVTDANADALQRVLRQPHGPVLVHCASGNRAGALIALGAARTGMPEAQALALGKAAGMASTEAAVRERIAAGRPKPGGD